MKKRINLFIISMCLFMLSNISMGYVPVKKEVLGAWKVETRRFETREYNAVLSVKGRHEYRFENTFYYHVVDGKIRSKAFWGLKDGELRFAMLKTGSNATKRRLKINYIHGTRDRIVLQEAMGEGVLVTVLTRDYASELIMAAKNNNLHMLLVALKSGVGPDVSDISDKRKTALHFAAERGFIDIVEALLTHKANKDLQDSDGKTASDLSKANGHSEITNILENTTNQENAGEVEDSE